MATITVRVTKKHIKNGKPGIWGRCPIALAMQDAGFKKPFADAEAVCGTYKGVYEVWESSIKMQKFVVAFDTKKSVKPFVFALRVPNL